MRFPSAQPQAWERKVLLHYICREHGHQNGVAQERRHGRKVLPRKEYADVNQRGESQVGCDAAERIGDGVMLLAYEIGEEHRGEVSAEASPGAGHVAIFRHEDDVHQDEDEQSGAGEYGAPVGLAYEFVPE